MNTPGSFRFFALLLLWIGAVMAGLFLLTRYSLESGAPGSPQSEWPPAAAIAHPVETMCLILSAHPHCPCTRASIEELARIMARQPGSTEAHVLFWAPEGSPDWARGGLWKSAAAIPGVTVHADEGGVEANRFGLETSGHTLLYSQKGKLLFAGGITASPGHQGSSAGQTAILNFAAGRDSAVVESPVYGCPLFDPIQRQADL